MKSTAIINIYWETGNGRKFTDMHWPNDLMIRLIELWNSDTWLITLIYAFLVPHLQLSHCYFLAYFLEAGQLQYIDTDLFWKQGQSRIPR